MKKLFALLACTVAVHAANLPKYETIEDAAGLEILSPTLSERQTAKIKLPNGLEAYLISDPGVEQSAAALAVGTGSWDDPTEYPGMAHFLEHMLFMGTKAYPNEGEYMQYIRDNGGVVNAYTASDRTVYMFSVNNSAFDGALDRFSHFFIDPLFNPNSIERELHAVDQEHSKNIENDGWRHYFVFKETGNQKHQNAKFSTGNADTLRGIPQEAMKKWYQTNYSADKMHLVVLSALPINELIDLTVQDFSSIAKNPPTKQDYSATITTDQQLAHMIYIKPIKNLKVLSLSWELPTELAKSGDAKVGPLLAYILKNGRENSLLSLLKEQHLAEQISLAEEKFSNDKVFFNIDVELTERGITQVDQVITYVFEALARIKKTGIPRYIYDEVRQIASLQYEYQSREEAFRFVQTTADAMTREALATFPQKSLLPTQYSPRTIKHYVDQLSANNCTYYVICDPKLTNVFPNKKERWVGVEYAIEPISPKQLRNWQNATINPYIALPGPNPYIPKSQPLVYTKVSENPVTPRLLESSDEATIYFSGDEKYLSPESTYLFKIKSPLLDGSAKAIALCDLYIKALDDKLSPITSAAQTAGSSIMLQQDKLSFIVATHGFSESSTRLIEEVLAGVKDVLPTRAQFNIYKHSLTSLYENTSKELPYIQSQRVLSNILFNDAPTTDDKIAALSNISYEDFLDFSAGLLKKIHVEGLLYGNLKKNEARGLWNQMKVGLAAEGYPADEQHKRQILTLPEGQGPYMVAKPTPMQGNAVLLYLEQGPYSFEKRASQQILGQVLQDAFFNTLRTKQQVAYIARAWDREEEQQLVQYFAVQSSDHAPDELIVRFELFLENFLKQYSTIFSEERFENIQKMAVASLKREPENSKLMAARLFQLAFDYDGDFNLVDKRIAALEKVTYDETKSYAQSSLSRANNRRIAVLVEGMTPREQEFKYEMVSTEELQNNGTYVTKAARAKTLNVR